MIYEILTAKSGMITLDRVQMTRNRYLNFNLKLPDTP